MALSDNINDRIKDSFIEPKVGDGAATKVMLLARGVSVGDTATVTTPGAGVAVVTIASGSLPAGYYEVRAKAGYGGTADVINNMRIQKGATTIMVLPLLAVVNNLQETLIPRVQLDGTQALTINAIAAGAVGSIYEASLVATRVE